MAKFTSGTRFKCNQSGNVFEFFTDHDIKTMRAHSEYSEVKEEAVVQEPKKPLGRPPKSIQQVQEE